MLGLFLVSCLLSSDVWIDDDLSTLFNRMNVEAVHPDEAHALFFQHMQSRTVSQFVYNLVLAANNNGIDWSSVEAIITFMSSSLDILERDDVTDSLLSVYMDDSEIQVNAEWINQHLGLLTLSLHKKYSSTDIAMTMDIDYNEQTARQFVDSLVSNS
jgi:hypothetical protein